MAATGAVLATGASSAEAIDYPVTNLNDTGAGSLRAALTTANGTPAIADTVTFASNLSGRLEANGVFPITSPVSIIGPGAGAVTVDANNHASVFAINVAALAPVTISGLTLNQGDNTPSSGGGIFSYGAALTVDGVVIDDNVAQYGGGIYAGHGTLTVRNSTIIGNRATGAGDPIGGGIAVNQTPGTDPVEITITGSTITGNSSAGYGGGAYFRDVDNDVVVRNTTVAGNEAAEYGAGLGFDPGDGTSNAVTVDSSTFSGNEAGGGGGALYFHGGTQARTIVNSTIAGNSANFAGGVYASNTSATSPLVVRSSTIVGNTGNVTIGGILIDTTGGGGSGQQTISSSIVSGNTRGAGIPSDLKDDGTPFQVGNSLIGTTDGATAIVQSPAGTNKIGVSPQLGPLQNNGGATQTMAPALSSPAVDSGVANTLLTDQRGLTRTVVQPTLSLSAGSDGTDIGAVELAAVAKVPVTPPDIKVDGAKVDAKPTQKQKGKKVVITVAAGAAEAVSLEASGSVSVGKKKIPLKGITTKADAGKQATLDLSPSGKKGSKQILSALKKGKPAVPKVLILLTDGAQNSVTVEPKIKLK